MKTFLAYTPEAEPHSLLVRADSCSQAADAVRTYYLKTYKIAIMELGMQEYIGREYGIVCIDKDGKECESPI
jgi:hypothetical protein